MPETPAIGLLFTTDNAGSLLASSNGSVARGGGVSAHERAPDAKEEWLTPPEIIHALGAFDLDPCAPVKRPWDMARRHYTWKDNGLGRLWEGRVWLNPPYGNETSKWMGRLREHGNGIGLIFVRTETDTWFRHIWGSAAAILFIKGRLCFYNVDGTRGMNSAGAPSALIAYGEENASALRKSGITGCFVAGAGVLQNAPLNGLDGGSHE